MFKLITLSDYNYFDSGKLFLKTRDKIDADVVLYGPDLTEDQQNILFDHKIQYKKVDPDEFKNKMQFLKYEMCLNEIKEDEKKIFSGFTLMDIDVFFVNDWSHIYNYDFDLCIIARTDDIKSKTIRALGCGGGFFFKHSAKELFEYGQKVMINGSEPGVPEYDRIWKTLEIGRPEHKTHYRTSLRWWVDQVFISSIVLRFLEKNKYMVKFGFEPLFYDFNGFKIAFVSDRNYNVLNSQPVIKKESGNIFIRHLKEIGRSKLVGAAKAKAKEKL
jgi:hypothetical protein